MSCEIVSWQRRWAWSESICWRKVFRMTPAMDESQGPGHWASVSQDLPFTSQRTPIQNYTAWWHRHVCVNNLPKDRYLESNSRPSAPWAEALQIGHQEVDLHVSVFGETELNYIIYRWGKSDSVSDSLFNRTDGHRESHHLNCCTSHHVYTATSYDLHV